MTLDNSLALFITMIVLAAIPSISVLTVIARTISGGFGHGLFTSIGIVLGDIVFIMLALLGLTLLTEAMANLFIIIKYIAGFYLIIMGILLWRAKISSRVSHENTSPRLLSSFMAGLLLTLADHKAILFYLALLPAFIRLDNISFFDINIIIAITIVAVGGTKIAYAFMTYKGGVFFNDSKINIINKIAASTMVTIGGFLIIRG